MASRKAAKAPTRRRRPPTPPARGRAGGALATNGAVDVVVLAGSAGANTAIRTVLAGLPADFRVPIVVAQHLAPSSASPDLYTRHLPFKAEWARSGAALAAGRVLACPPRSFLELLPDGTCAVSRSDSGPRDRPVDRLLTSVARSFGPRAIGVILSGMMDDGAEGARQLHLAGGSVLVQAESSAEYPSMPRAAIKAGGATLVVPLGDIAQVIVDLVAGTPRPHPRSEREALRWMFGDSGEIAACARRIDWTKTPLGAAVDWPEHLRVVVRMVAEAAQPMAVWCGRELIQIYNEPWRALLGGAKHPGAFGQRAAETWAEKWPELGPMVDRVLKRGEALRRENYRLMIDRDGYPEEVYVTISHSPVRDPRGKIVGVLHSAWDTTKSVVAERRVSGLRSLAGAVAGAGSPRDACERAAAVLASLPADLPFALLYLLTEDRRQAVLAGALGFEPGSSAAPHVVNVSPTAEPWPLARVLDESPAGRGQSLLDDLPGRLHGVGVPAALAAGTPAARAALLLPLRVAVDAPPVGVLVAGLAPQRPLDDEYRGFLDIIAQQIYAAVAEGRVRQLEREQRDRLAALDRAKTEFFANVSHEFRTPITLMLGPLEDLLRQEERTPEAVVGALEVAVRNGRRLATLVSNLLDFSQMEARRQPAKLELTDLGALTTDVVSVFRSAIESAGLRLSVFCDPRLPPVPVDRQMWEKVISNLLSNALKFTFKGEIAIGLRPLSLHAELTVSDTGVGIPEAEMPNLFTRFHRIPGTRRRTAEGSGIGLATVRDLVTRMGGQIRAASQVGKGTSFTIWMPYKSVRSTPEADMPASSAKGAAGTSIQMANEASRWLVGTGSPDRFADGLLGPTEVPGAPVEDPSRQRIVVVDDNADMREYLGRILSPHWRVELAADGERAFALVRETRADLLLADVMLPDVDGFALLKRIRQDPSLKTTPVVLVTARAGEQAPLDGLLAGADDYIAKPFSTRELVARVGGQLALAAMRRRTEELNAFLVRFSDAIRDLTDARAIAKTACRMVVEQLRTGEAHWTETDRATKELVLEDAFRVADPSGSPHRSGRLPLDAWEPFASSPMAGRSVVIDDAHTDRTLPAPTKAELAAREAQAVVAVPVEVGKLAAALAVIDGRSRRWTDPEVALVTETAHRTSAAIERARAEAALREKEAIELADARALQRISSSLIKEGNVDALYEELLDAARSLMRSEMASIQELSPERNELHLLAHRGFAAESAAFWEWVGAGQPSACGVTLDRGAPTVVPDVEAWDLVAGTEDLAHFRKCGIRAVLSTPLLARDGRLVGVISTHWRDVHRPTERELHVFDVLARQAADLIERRAVQEALRAAAQPHRRAGVSTSLNDPRSDKS